jgi:hypothetical protein
MFYQPPEPPKEEEEEEGPEPERLEVVTATVRYDPATETTAWPGVENPPVTSIPADMPALELVVVRGVLQGEPPTFTILSVLGPECPACKGEGRNPLAPEGFDGGDCPVCEGRGYR